MATPLPCKQYGNSVASAEPELVPATVHTATRANSAFRIFLSKTNFRFFFTTRSSIHSCDSGDSYSNSAACSSWCSHRGHHDSFRGSFAGRDGMRDARRGSQNLLRDHAHERHLADHEA